MSGSTGSTYDSMFDPHLIVKFRSDLDHAVIHWLFAHRFSASTDVPADLPQVLDWEAIFAAAEGVASLSFGPLASDQTLDDLMQVAADGREFRAMLREHDTGYERDRAGNQLSYEAAAEEAASHALSELETFFRLDLDPLSGATEQRFGAIVERLVEIINGHAETVEIAYVAVDPAPPPRARSALLGLANATHPQGYFAPRASGGMGIAAFLRANPKADGRGVRLVDVEQGWYADHPDLPAIPFQTPLSGDNIALADDFPNPADPDLVYSHDVGLHGLMTLGLLAARHDGQGVNGVAPGLDSIGLVSEWVFNPAQARYVGNTPAAILTATAALRPGDVLLLEGQVRPPSVSVDGVSRSNTHVPMEMRPDLFAAIRAATQKGITVIEPAGNNISGGISLDNVSITLGGQVQKLFKQDSGAIVVAAANNTPVATTHVPAPSSNVGKAVDCFADGDWLWVLDQPPFNRPAGTQLTCAQLAELYEHVDSGGTSSASALVAGVAVLLQSLARRSGRIVPPLTLRAILSDPQLNTSSKQPSQDRIGVMPDLEAIVKKHKKLKTVSIPVS